MRRGVKNEIISILDTIDKANRSIKSLIEKEDYNSLQVIAESCQNAAIMAGEAIENSEGDEAVAAVKPLEGYCEYLYQLLIGETKDSSKLYEYISDCRKEINKIEIKKEVVFFPYKASMWDSLESMWEKEKEDKEAEVLVVPIPYYDKNPDGTVKEEHYEINEYPDYVDVIDYRNYDIEKNRPDKVYIHNPYDECNYVTTVHPGFYSSRIKNYTDELVYIPYFVLSEPNVDDERNLEGMEHFVLVPGVINADTVIVQSENMRQAYIKILCKNIDQKVISRHDWQKKILGTGSPKFDKVLNTVVNDEDIPEEWKKIIFKKDGTRKKIILYNNSVTTLLDKSDEAIGKIKRVLETFYENKENVVLLWRPHPLIKATIESMRPALRDDYNNVVEEFRNAGWGIYDDTADLNRAIALSDAYYGDASSLVQLYQKVKKPIMIQNVQI